MNIRTMRDTDADAVLRIYQAGIDSGHASFETTAPTWDVFDAGKLPDHRYVAVDSTGSDCLIASSALLGALEAVSGRGTRLERRSRWTVRGTRRGSGATVVDASA